MRDAIKELSAAGVGAITYQPSGRVDTLETAVRRAIVTGVNKTAGEVQWQLADEMGCDLVQVTAHGGARPEHAAWQGGIYSRSGKSKKYKDFKETTGYGTGAGLCGWNCRHSFGPYIEGAPKAYSDKMLENYNAEKYEYNGQKMTEYEASQKQREIERNIRRWKRENKAMEAAGLDTSESAEKVRYWQARQRDFVRQTGLKRQYSREQVGSVTYSEVAKKITENAKKKYGVGMTMSANRGILSKEQETAIFDYMSAKSYSLNAALRAQEPLSEELQKLKRNLDYALAKLPDYKGTVYRSISSEYIGDVAAFWKMHKVGDVVLYDAFTSTSKVIYDKSMDIQFVIQSKHGKDISLWNTNEQEILFRRGTMFEITKISGNTIFLEEV